MRNVAGYVLPTVLIGLGVAIVIRTLAAGGGALAFGLLMGILFVAAGAARIVLERKR
jgi:hypothetical protein